MCTRAKPATCCSACASAASIYIICRSQYIAPEFENRVVMDEPLRIALPPDHPLHANDRPVRIEDLKNERFMLHNSLLGTGITDMLMRSCHEAGFTPEVIYTGVETLHPCC